MSRFLEPDHAKGDERTIGGYAAVHARPAAFEGRDGWSYSVEMIADRVDSPEGAYGAFLLFVQWKRFGAQGVEGHLESGFLAHGDSGAAAKAALGRTTVEEVQRILDALIIARDAQSPHPSHDEGRAPMAEP